MSRSAIPGIVCEIREIMLDAETGLQKLRDRESEVREQYEDTLGDIGDAQQELRQYLQRLQTTIDTLQDLPPPGE